MANITRRQVAKGAAWAAPVIVIGAAAPLATASPEPCQFTVLPGSFKCCADGPNKTMYLNLQLGTIGDCGGVQTVCIADVLLSNGQPIGFKTVDGVDLASSPVCVTPGVPFVVLLQDVKSCAADLLFVDTEGNSRIVKSGNIPGGDETECVTRAGG